MKQNLVIVESPSKAGSIKGYLGSNYKVVASIGHIRDLPKSYLGIDINDNFKAKYINIRGKGDLIKELVKDAKEAKEVYLATDPDREGEAISWHLAEVLDIPIEKTRRVTFNEITKDAVKKGIANPRNIDMNLVDSQQTRRLLDRIVGYKLSPFLWKTVKSGLSAGRVQSVAVKIIVDRENEINAFVPTEFWTIDTTFNTEKGKSFKSKFYGDENGKIELANGVDAEKIVNAVKGGDFFVKSVKKSTKQKNPQPPFSTSSMQQEASRRLSFSSFKTMKIAQELYEGINLGSELGGTHGLITYMRTDSLRISESAQSEARKYIVENYGDKYCPKTPKNYKTKSSAQDAHEAIRPSNVLWSPDRIKSRLTNDQYKLYKLIWTRFVASQMSSAELDTVAAEIECNNYIFKSSGYSVKFAGYQTLYDDTDKGGENENSEMEKTKLPPLENGQKVNVEEILPNQHFTEPVPRFTEGSFIKYLEENGIGRPSTFATIVTTIIQRGYVVKEGKVLKPTKLGEMTNDLMVQFFSDIIDNKFSAEMENKLDSVAEGKHEMTKVLEEFYKEFEKDLVNAMEHAEKQTPPLELTDTLCEKCGKPMAVMAGRFGKFLACSDYPKCKFTIAMNKDGTPKKKEKEEETEFKCEICGAPVVVKNGRFGKFYACSNYPTCKYTKKNDEKLGVKCPKCGGEIIVKHTRKAVFYGCANYPKCDFSSWDIPTEKKCPNCCEMLFQKGKKLICHNAKCKYEEKIN